MLDRKLKEFISSANKLTPILPDGKPLSVDLKNIKENLPIAKNALVAIAHDSTITPADISDILGALERAKKIISRYPQPSFDTYISSMRDALNIGLKNLAAKFPEDRRIQEMINPPQLTVNSEGDGNCAFNSFILGIRKMVVANQITTPPADFNLFLASFSKFVKDKKISNWEEFKKYLEKDFPNTREGLRKLQIKLAPVFRDFAIRRIETGQGFTGKYHKEETLTLIKEDFRKYCENKRGIPGTRNDIFSHLSFINQEFDRLYSSLKEKKGEAFETELDRLQETELTK